MADTAVEQVGGDHYAAAYQHWDLVEDHDVGYLEATATKYLARWRSKGTPALDLGKAASYVEKALRCREREWTMTATGDHLTRRRVPQAALDHFVASAGVHWQDAEAMAALLVLGTRAAYEETLGRLRATLAQLETDGA